MLCKDVEKLKSLLLVFILWDLTQKIPLCRVESVYRSFSGICDSITWEMQDFLLFVFLSPISVESSRTLVQGFPARSGSTQARNLQRRALVTALRSSVRRTALQRRYANVRDIE